MLFVNLEISNLLTNSLFFIIRKFIVIRCHEIFTFKVLLLFLLYKSKTLTFSSNSINVLATMFSTVLFNLLKSAGIVSNLSTSNLSTLLFKLFKPTGTFMIH